MLPQGDSVPVVIVVEPARRADGKLAAGLYVATLAGDARPLVKSRAPLLDAARILLARGYAPGATILMRWRGGDVDSLSAPLGVAAALAVDEGPPMRFVRYRGLPHELRK
jgi:hypothetical protein